MYWPHASRGDGTTRVLAQNSVTNQPLFSVPRSRRASKICRDEGGPPLQIFDALFFGWCLSGDPLDHIGNNSLSLLYMEGIQGMICRADVEYPIQHDG